MDLQQRSPSYLAVWEPWQRGISIIWKTWNGDQSWLWLQAWGLCTQRSSKSCSSLSVCHLFLITCPLFLRTFLQGNTPPVVVNTDTLDGSPYVRIRSNLLFIVWLCYQRARGAASVQPVLSVFPVISPHPGWHVLIVWICTITVIARIPPN